MTSSPQPPPGAPPPDELPSECTAATLFESLWENVADVLGVAATAALIRRSAKHATMHAPGRESVTITREGFRYRYQLPERWSARGGEAIDDLRALVHALLPLLAELTGPVVVRRIESLSAFRRCGLLPPGAG